MKPIPTSWQAGSSSDSTERFSSEYSDCVELRATFPKNGFWMVAALANCQDAKLETPT